MSSFSTTEWITLVAIPFVVSIVANLFTPVFQRWLIAAASKASHTSNKATVKLLLVRAKQIRSEILEIERYRSDPNEQVKLLEGAVNFCQLGLWVLLLSPLLGLVARNVSQYLPWLYGNPDFAFVATIAAFAGAGPFQAAIYCSVVQRKLKKIRNAEGHIGKMSKELKSIAPFISSPNES